MNSVGRLDGAQQGMRDLLLAIIDARRWEAVARRHVAGQGAPFAHATATYLRARPPEMALIGFRLEQERGAAPIFGYVAILPRWRVDQALGQLAHRRHGKLAAHASADPVEGWLVCTLPADRRIRGADMLLDPPVLAKRMRRSLPRTATGKIRTHAEHTTSRVASYKPERRLVCRVETRVGEGGSLSPFALYGRAYPGQDAGRRIQEGRAIWNSPELAAAFRLAEPLGHDERGWVAFFREIPGARFETLEPEVALTAWGRTGAALAVLHRFEPTMVRSIDATAIARRLDSAVEALAFVSPALGERASRLARELRSAVPPSGPARLVHGDFYDHQLLWDGQRPALLDYDELAAGDPRVDVANCVAHLVAAEGDGRLPAANAARAFLDGYRSASRKAFAPRTLGWFGACALLELAVGPFRTLQPDFETRCDRRVALAEAAWKGEDFWNG